MFEKFQLNISDDFYHSQIDKPEYIKLGNEMYHSFGKESHDCLMSFIYENGKIDGTALKEHWFRIQPADIFISHSHKDIDKVKAFAGWLNHNFGLKVFIDSCAWGYADDLLKLIDDKYCFIQDSNAYNYTLRNYTTSYVHMMLSTALTEMIDHTECLLFYKTPNSIVMSEEIQNIEYEKKDRTISPWIYHELSISTMIRKQLPERLGTGLRTNLAQESCEIQLVVEEALKEMIVIYQDDLMEWEKTKQQSKHALDTLYKIKEVSMFQNITN